MPLQDKADDASIHPVEAAHDEQIGLEMHIHEMRVYMKCTFMKCIFMKCTST